MKTRRAWRWVGGIIAILVVDRRLHRAVRLHPPHGGEERRPRRRCSQFTLAHRVGDLSTTSSPCCSTRDYLLVRAFVNSTDPHRRERRASWSCSRAMVGYVLQRRKSRWNPLVNFFVLAGLIIPPAVVPTIWVHAGPRHLQDACRA